MNAVETSWPLILAFKVPRTAVRAYGPVLDANRLAPAGSSALGSALKGRVEEPAADLSLCLDLASGSIWKLTSVGLGLMGDFPSA